MGAGDTSLEGPGGDDEDISVGQLVEVLSIDTQVEPPIDDDMDGQCLRNMSFLELGVSAPPG